ncbi:hypothetical protein N7468_006193 [Penicillium chermesinum]|uniref:Uncharacterized protein n=1 Tax=Penicillium chermesinum TaxID=63820 RepID=A0A9W9NS88_9EURO|nr:uncharacterized protein N7468_006193 [Penicillium chermesinum]KAJ5224968.1 hypothetical protein N7468_006193 [Penicillium chermesinum]KAJ6151696.1 hypothetical protein N7470_006824 [Penicillium chermesinum]
MTTGSTPAGNIEIAASQVPTPGISQNFMAPVNYITNKRCQEWTMNTSVIWLLKVSLARRQSSKRDPPSQEIGLRAIIPQ